MDKTARRGIFSNSHLILPALVGALLVVNILFIVLTRNAGATVGLLKNELTVLDEQERIIASSQDIYLKYQNEIETISNVFPNEETRTVFIQTLEKELREVTQEHTFRFSSVTPLKEQDKLFLPLTITLKSSLADLARLFEKFEDFPYMMHVTQINAKSPEGFTGKSEVTIMVKLYVQNPFST